MTSNHDSRLCSVPGKSRQTACLPIVTLTLAMPNISMWRYTFTTYLSFQTHNIVIHNLVCIIYYYYIIINLITTLYCPKVYFSPCTTCINTASVGAAIVVSRAMWRQSAELGVHRSSTSSRVGSHGFDCRSSALSRVEGWKNTCYGLPGTQHKTRCSHLPLNS